MGISIADDVELTKDQAFAAMVFFYSELQRHRNTQRMIEQCIYKLQKEHDFSIEEIVRARELSEKYVTFDEELVS